MLKIGYYSMFKGQPTLLLSGSDPEILALRHVFAQWGRKTASLVAQLRACVVVSLEGIDDLALTVDLIGCASRIELTGNKLVWRISFSQCDRIVGLLDDLCADSRLGHQYLESGTDVIQILCSKDEY